jgi:hypothetical protein
MNQYVNEKSLSVISLKARLRLLFIAVLMTAHAMLSSFLGGPPMLA